MIYDSIINSYEIKILIIMLEKVGGGVKYTFNILLYIILTLI